MSNESLQISRVVTRSTYLEIQRDLYGREDNGQIKAVIRVANPTDVMTTYTEGAIKKYSVMYGNTLLLPRARVESKYWLRSGSKAIPSPWQELVDNSIEVEGKKIAYYELDFIMKTDYSDILPNDAMLLYYYFLLRGDYPTDSNIDLDTFSLAAAHFIDYDKVEIDMKRLHDSFNFTMTPKEYILIPLFYIIIENPNEFKAQFKHAIKLIRHYENEIKKHFKSEEAEQLFNVKIKAIENWANDTSTPDIDPDRFLDFIKYLADMSNEFANIENYKNISALSSLRAKYGANIVKPYIVEDKKSGQVGVSVQLLENKLKEWYARINGSYTLQELGYTPDNYILGIILELMFCGYYPALAAGVMPLSIYAQDVILSEKSNQDNKSDYYPLDYFVPSHWCNDPPKNKKSNKGERDLSILLLGDDCFVRHHDYWNAKVAESFKDITNINMAELMKLIINRLESGKLDGKWRNIVLSRLKPKREGNRSDTTIMHRYIASHIAGHILAAAAGAEFTYKVATLGYYSVVANQLSSVYIMPMHAHPAIYPRIRINIGEDNMSFDIDIDHPDWAYPPIREGSPVGSKEFGAAQLHYVSNVEDVSKTYDLDRMHVFELYDKESVAPDMSVVMSGNEPNKTNTIDVTGSMDTSSTLAEQVYKYEDEQKKTIRIIYKSGEQTHELFKVTNFTYSDSDQEEVKIEWSDNEQNL